MTAPTRQHLSSTLGERSLIIGRHQTDRINTDGAAANGTCCKAFPDNLITSSLQCILVRKDWSEGVGNKHYNLRACQMIHEDTPTANDSSCSDAKVVRHRCSLKEVYDSVGCRWPRDAEHRFPHIDRMGDCHIVNLSSNRHHHRQVGYGSQRS